MRDPEDAGELCHHGGNINAARRRFPNAPTPWIDLSTGINPLPYPVGDISPSAWQRLPDAADLADLEAAARLAYGASRSAGIVAAPGTQSLIQWLPRLFPARRVGVLGLTYGEHAATWRAAGAAVTRVDALRDLADFDVAVVVNPNNPDGHFCSPADLAGLAERNRRLIVDEAFMDVIAPSCSLVPRLPPDTIVLRSFGKAYGLAGLRLGFALASPADSERLRAALGPWPVSGPAIDIGRRALHDLRWLADTIARLAAAANRLDALLSAAGFEPLGGTPLFRLVSHPDAGARFERLGRAGILTRPFPARPDWLRIGLPPTETAWSRLAAAI